MNTILQNTRRGKLDEGMAAAMKKLEKDKMLRALSDQRYANTVYEQEMTQMDTAWIWELSGYCAKYSFLTKPKGLTM